MSIASPGPSFSLRPRRVKQPEWGHHSNFSRSVGGGSLRDASTGNAPHVTQVSAALTATASQTVHSFHRFCDSPVDHVVMRHSCCNVASSNSLPTWHVVNFFIRRPKLTPLRDRCVRTAVSTSWPRERGREVCPLCPPVCSSAGSEGATGSLA